MNYTKGPWFYRPNPHDDWGYVRDRDGHVVARAANPHVSMQEYADHRAAKTDPYEANGRLIAAAPELVEALEMMLRAWEEIDGTDELIGYQKGVAALAKAGVG